MLQIDFLASNVVMQMTTRKRGNRKSKTPARGEVIDVKQKSQRSSRKKRTLEAIVTVEPIERISSVSPDVNDWNVSSPRASRKHLIRAADMMKIDAIDIKTATAIIGSHRPSSEEFVKTMLLAFADARRRGGAASVQTVYLNDSAATAFMREEDLIDYVHEVKSILVSAGYDAIVACDADGKPVFLHIGIPF